MEITTGQWLEFVNTFWTQGTQPGFWALPIHWGATRDLDYQGPGRRYELRTDVATPELLPVFGISWRDAAMFCNWLHNNKSIDPASRNDGAYDTSTFMSDDDGVFTDQRTHHPDARFWILPSMSGSKPLTTTQTASVLARVDTGIIHIAPMKNPSPVRPVWARQARATRFPRSGTSIFPWVHTPRPFLLGVCWTSPAARWSGPRRPSKRSTGFGHSDGPTVTSRETHLISLTLTGLRLAQRLIRGMRSSQRCALRRESHRHLSDCINSCLRGLYLPKGNGGVARPFNEAQKVPRSFAATGSAI
jgi:hypothetical protein